MKLDKSYRNIASSVAAFLVCFGVFKLAGIVVEAIFWLITILLILMYFELLDRKKK